MEFTVWQAVEFCVTRCSNFYDEVRLEELESVSKTAVLFDQLKEKSFH